MTSPHRRLLILMLAAAACATMATACGSVASAPTTGGDDPSTSSDTKDDAALSDEGDASTEDAPEPGDGSEAPSDIAVPSDDIAQPPLEDTTEPAEDAGPGVEDVTPPEEDTTAPTEDILAPEEDTEAPLCVAGETACDEGWVVVCAPGGEVWNQIVECDEDSPCFDGTCCNPSCDGSSCGDDGCGGSCGACADDETCEDSACVCAPQCDGKNCGDDGCGGVCGECAEGDLCDSGVCLCIPDCGGAMCGGDGCGGSCGACPADNTCSSGVCVGPCAPGDTRCNAGSIEVCNPDGETWTSIATCAEDMPCFEGTCCTPVCDGVSCGSDGCGGSCGACGDQEACVSGSCLPTCDAPGETGCAEGHVTLCSPEGMLENLLDCASLGQVCSEGECVEPVIPPADCPEECTGTSIEAALCALDICYADYLVGAEMLSPTDSVLDGAYAAMAHYGDADNDLAPTQAPSYFVMASGMIDSSEHSDGLEGNGAAPDPFASDGYDMRDAVEFKLDLVVPEGVTGFSLDFIFMSVEYEEWIGSSFNDKFYLILEAGDSDPTVINYAACSDPDTYFDFENESGKWCYIAINTAYSEPCSNPSTNISGTGFECDKGSSTGWLRTTHPVQSGEAFTLTLHIHDTSDQIYDSAAIIDNFQWLAGDVIHETVPISPDGCEGESPAGCSQTGCADDALCMPSPDDECIPTACTCTGAGEWVCADDCSGGVCTPISMLAAIVIELNWSTPEDEDQSDTGPEAGTDLDLHLAHPSAMTDEGIAWMESPWDCFWFNPNPNWGSLTSPDDDPSMVLDDTDGQGPEIIALYGPDMDATYTIGAHYWNDNGYGDSLVSIRVWVAGQLAATLPSEGENGEGPDAITLSEGDLWEAATVHWPSGEVIELLDEDSGEPLVTPNFETDVFDEP